MNKQNKITITVSKEQCTVLYQEARRRGYTVSQMLREWVVDVMDAEGILPQEHLCPQCGTETFGRPTQICDHCDKLIPQPHAEPEDDINYQYEKQKFGLHKSKSLSEIVYEAQHEPK